MKRSLVIAGIAAFSLFVSFFIGGYLIFNSYIGKINYDPGSGSAVFGALPEDGTAGSSDSSQADIDTLEQSIRDNMAVSSVPIIYDNDVFNVLLIGIDTRAMDNLGHSDSMILLSINRKTSKIITTSLLRDIYLSIPGVAKGNRLNVAYLIGGPKLLLQTIEENFKVKVDKYISVNFYSFINIVDQIGGISVDVTSDEIKVVNYYVHELNHLTGTPFEDGCLFAPGVQNLNGKQALSYARIRYIGNADFGRTDRQRLVMKLVFEKITHLNLSDMNTLLNTYLPEVTTNMTKGELFTLILSIPAFANYSLDSWYIPTDGSYSYLTIRGMSVLGIDFRKNINEMQDKIYR